MSAKRKMTRSLESALQEAASDDRVGVVIELAHRPGPLPSLPRSERVRTWKDQFAKAAEPVEDAVRAVGGRIMDAAWINPDRTPLPTGLRPPLYEIRDLAELEPIVDR